MSISFITNPEIQLTISNKSLPGKKKVVDGANSSSTQVKFSERELELLKKINKLETSEKQNENKAKKSSKKDKTTTLSLQEVKDLKKQFGDSSFLCDIINSAELKLPENEFVARNPVLEKRIQRLKAQQEQVEYNSMTKNVDASRKHIPEETISYQCKFYRSLRNRASQVTLTPQLKPS